MMVDEINKLYREVHKELILNILPFWMNKATDREFGGFYGQINGRGHVVFSADKGGILNARILWTFSAVYNRLKNKEYLKTAQMSKDYILAHFFDRTYQGTYWKITFDGKPIDTKKQIYSQAFFIYALSEYFRATGDNTCLDEAISLYHLIEDKSSDNKLNGYFEAYNREWELLEDLRLSARDANEKKTTNTHLHILEAYTNLYKVWKDKELGQKLKNLVNLFLDKIIDRETHHLKLFFDEQWNSKSSLISYGHDIEASWLIYEAARALNDKSLLENSRPVCINLAIAALEGLQNDGSLMYEKDDAEGINDPDRHWWPQAETVVGLLNLYEITDNDMYFSQAVKCWNYIMQNIVDQENGEWYWSIKPDGKPNLADDKAGFWKCPYHNARACLEVMVRCERIMLKMRS